MIARAATEQEFAWPEYYQEFTEFSRDTVRPGCHPRRMLHEHGAGRAIVLVHGLTDSPYFMVDLGRYFYEKLGYDVYIPLLQCHGLKRPAGMTGVSLAEWKKNVLFAIDGASRPGVRVSIGGLSTGGALSFYMACTCPQIGGDLYLFSAALGLAPVLGVVPGWLQEYMLRTPITRILDSGKLLIGENPFRYERVSLNCAKELAHLIKENNSLQSCYSPYNLLEKRIFAVTTGFDKVVSLPAIKRLRTVVGGDRFVRFDIPAEARVDHACVVLKEPVYALNGRPGDPPLERANPLFVEMVEQMRLFSQEIP